MTDYSVVSPCDVHVIYYIHSNPTQTSCSNSVGSTCMSTESQRVSNEFEYTMECVHTIFHRVGYISALPHPPWAFSGSLNLNPPSGKGSVNGSTSHRIQF